MEIEKPFVGIPIPEDCKAIYVCTDKDQFKYWLEHSSMKALLDDDPEDRFFMPVFIAYRPVTPDQTYLEALFPGPVDE